MLNNSQFDIEVDIFGSETHEIPKITIAVPAKNEEDVILSCLSSLANQEEIDLRSIKAVFVLNNCTDGTYEAIKSFETQLKFPVVTARVNLPSGFQTAGWARKLAMDCAATLTAENGYILSTDADSIPDSDWVARKHDEFIHGADAVAGFVTADWSELSKMPEEILSLGALEWEYQGLSAELEAKADPQSHDPWKRHNQNCGASMAIKAHLYTSIGGLPPLPVGEDRALFDAVRKKDGKIRHSLNAHVTASARMVGRASGGMADALRLRGSQDYLCDDILEPADDLLYRNIMRSDARKAWKKGNFENWILKSGFRADNTIFESFGLAWENLEKSNSNLAYKRLQSNHLPLELTKIRNHIDNIDRLNLKMANLKMAS